MTEGGVSSSSGLHERYEQQHEYANLQRGGPRYNASQLERPSSVLRRWSYAGVALVTPDRQWSDDIVKI
jgi:hypothetical protein